VLKTSMERLPNGRRVRVARTGTGPPLLLLHGYPDNLQIWSEVAPRLAGQFEVIAFDWPGMGYSEAWPGGATPFQMADRLVELLDAWGVAHATVAGMDVGGQPALALAAMHPERVERLIVMNSLVMWDEKTSWEIGVLRKFGWNRFLLRRCARLVFERAVLTSMTSSLPSELRRDLWDSFRRPDVRHFIARLCAAYQGTLPKLAEAYRTIACPTLLLWGEEDRHFPPAHGERLNANIRSSSLEIIAGAHHWMVWDRAEEVARRILAFTE